MITWFYAGYIAASVEGVAIFASATFSEQEFLEFREGRRAWHEVNN